MAKISIPMNLKETPESRPVPVGTYDLTIATVEQQKSKNSGKDQLKVSIGIDEFPTAPNVGHWISFPDGDDDVDKAKFKALQMRRFLEAFGIPYEVDGTNTSFDTDDFPGAKARMGLTVDSQEGSEETYNRLRLPKIKEDGGNAAGGKGKATRLSPPKR